jgi:hypothetical protein
MCEQSFKRTPPPPFETLFFGSALVFVYKIFGAQPGFADGLIFNSCVENLQDQPDLWLDECPFLSLRPSPTAPLKGLRVVLVSASDGAAAAAKRPMALAA